MSGIRSFFTTGANAKIVLNRKTLAFCTDISYSIQVLHQTPKVLGMYEGTSVEPLGYSVTGSFTLIRYAKQANELSGTSPGNTSQHGNSIGNWGTEWDAGGLAAAAGIGTDGRAQEGLNPSRFQEGTTFDIQIYQKINEPRTGRIIDMGVANIRNCRITQADFSLSKKSLAIQRFNFVALYVDEDAFISDFSGLGQQFDGGI